MNLKTNTGALSDDELRSASGAGKVERVYTQQKRADGSGGGNSAAKYTLSHLAG
jgi:hypothetical protein